MESSAIDDILERHGGQKSALIAVLQDVQANYSYLSEDVLQEISRKLEVPMSRIYSLATFYRAFSLKPTARHPVSICLGTACHVRGAVKILEKFERRLNIKCGQTTADLKFGLEQVRCLGCCGLAPVVTVGQELYGKVALPQVDKILKQHQEPQN